MLRVRLQSRTSMMRLVSNRTLMIRTAMRSGIVGNTMMQKRVRFICGHGITIRVRVDLFRGIPMPVTQVLH